MSTCLSLYFILLRPELSLNYGEDQQASRVLLSLTALSGLKGLFGHAQLLTWASHIQLLVFTQQTLVPAE